MTGSVDPTTADLMRVFNMMTVQVIEDPGRRNNLVTALHAYCDGTVKPAETLVVLAGFAIGLYATTLTELMGSPQAAIASLNATTLVTDVEDALKDVMWGDDE